MGINQTWCVIPIIFVSTASIHNARLFYIYDVRLPFLGEVHAIPPSCFVPSSVYSMVRPLRNATSVTRDHSLSRCGACGLSTYLDWSLLCGMSCNTHNIQYVHKHIHTSSRMYSPMKKQWDYFVRIKFELDCKESINVFDLNYKIHQQSWTMLDI